MSDGPSRSRLLRRLEQALQQAETTQVHEAIGLQRALYAAHLARHGLAPPAHAALTQLRAEVQAQPTPSLSAWLDVAEAMVALFADYRVDVAPLLQRGLAMASSAACVSAQGHARACLTQLAYLDNDVEALIEHARAALSLRGTDALEGALWQSRALALVGAAWHYVGGLAAAQPWYAEARQRASLAGDDATLSMLIFYAAELRALQLRLAELRGTHQQLPAQLAGVESSLHFDRAMGVRAIPMLKGTLRAKLLVVQGAHAEAVAAYDEHLPAAGASLPQFASALLADLAWSCLQLGQEERARRHMREAEAALSPRVDPADFFTTHSRLAHCHQQLGEPGAAQAHEARAEAAWGELAEMQRRWQAALQASGLRPDL